MPCFPGAEKKSGVEPKKKRQRGWGTQPPFHSTLHTKGGKSMRIGIDVPGPDEQCPLTMSAEAKPPCSCSMQKLAWPGQRQYFNFEVHDGNCATNCNCHTACSAALAPG